MNQSNDSSVERYVLKPAVIGTTGFLLSKSLLPTVFDSKWSQTFNFGAGSMLSRFSGVRSLSVPVMAGIAIGVGSLIAELAHSYIFPHIHWMDKQSEPVTIAVASGISSIGMYGALYQANPSAITELGAMPIIMAGVISEFVGDTVYTKFVKKNAESLFG
jgi:predicted Co/Zn/Cd cation transporter (cation efflux family)